MEIRIRQTGGFAGELELGKVETSKLGDRGKRIEQLVGAVQARSAAQGSVGADTPRYRITIVENGRERTVEKADEGGEDDVVRQLVDAVQQGG